MSTAFLGLVFLGTFVLVAAAVLFGRHFLAARQPAPPQSETTGEESDWLESLEAPNLLKNEQLSTISFWHGFLARVDGVEILKMRIAEAGLRWSVGRVTAAMLLAGASTLTILIRMDWMPRLAIVFVALTAASVPYVVILRRRAKRLFQFEQQFPEALDTLARALRAGNTLGAALEVLARETKAPLSTEIRKTVDERTLGLTWEQALQNLAERVPILEVSMFVATVQLQTRTGGRLHEVLMKLSETMREAASLKGEVRAITAHGRMTGGILTLLPIGIAATMTYVNPDHLLSLYRHPFGKDLILAAILCLIAAHVVIRKLVDIRI
jgi:tight adherence protein B